MKGIKLKLLQLAAVSLLFGPYFQSVYHMTALDVAAESTEVKEDEVFLDEDYQKSKGGISKKKKRLNGIWLLKRKRVRTKVEYV